MQDSDDIRPEQLMEDFADLSRRHSACEKILAGGKPMAACLFQAYLNRKPPHKEWLSLLFKMPSSAYSEYIAFAEKDNETGSDIFFEITNSAELFPEAIPIAIRGLDSKDLKKVRQCLDFICVKFHAHEAMFPELAAAYKQTHDRILELIQSDQIPANYGAIDCIGVMKPDATKALPLLGSCLQSIKDNYDLRNHCLAAIGNYGVQAKMLLPLLVRIYLSEPDWSATYFKKEFVKIGNPAKEYLSCILSGEEPAASDGQTHRDRIEEVIKYIQLELSKKQIQIEARAQWDVDPYLKNLLERMAQSEDYIGSSATSTSWAAFTESNHLKNIALFPEIEKLLKYKLTVDDFFHLTHVLGRLTRNTHSAEGSRIITQLLGKKNLPSSCIRYAIWAAKAASCREAYPIIRDLLLDPKKRWTSDGINYLENLNINEAADDLGRIIREDPKNRLLAILALGNLRTPRSIPYFLEMASRQLTTRKKEEQEWRLYSIMALGKIGDMSAAPKLLDLFSDPSQNRPALVLALSSLPIPEAFNAVLGELRKEKKYLAQRTYPPHFMAGVRTTFYNGMYYFIKSNQHQRPEVKNLMNEILTEKNCANLCAEEKDLVDHYFPLQTTGDTK